MSAAIAINPDEIQQISQPHTVNSSQLRSFARKAETLAIAAENRWEDFSPKERELLEVLIYTSIAHKGATNGLFSSLLTKLSLAWILIKGETDALSEYLNAVLRLKNAVLRAIEREHPLYEQKMAEVVQETLADSNKIPAMTPDEFSEWLNDV